MKLESLALLLSVSCLSCGPSYHRRPAKVEPHIPEQTCANPGGSPCVPVKAAMEIMRYQRFEIVGVEPAPAGLSRPANLTLAATYDGEPFIFEAKWKIAPADGGKINNSPRRELAAYQLQASFLEPSNYVVPPTVAICIDAQTHRGLVADVDPQFEDTDCIFGTLSYWLQDVTAEGARDEARLDHDPAYRRAFADMNVFTYLAGHADTRKGNILMSTGGELQLFSIDNGLTFSPPVQNIMANSLKKVKVSELPAETVAGLSSLGAAEFAALSTVAQFENQAGQLVPVPPTPPIDENDGIRYEQGILQLGLTSHEIEQVRDRWEDLIERIENRELAVTP